MAEEREKQGRPGNTSHMNNPSPSISGGREVDVGGVPNYKLVCN